LDGPEYELREELGSDVRRHLEGGGGVVVSAREDSGGDASPSSGRRSRGLR